MEKLVRVRKYLKTHGLEGVVLLSRANFAWLSGGGDSHIVSQSERGFGALAVTAKQAFLVANKIEIERIANEEPVSSFTPKSFPWIQSMADALPKIVGGNIKKFASDDPAGTGLAPLPGDFVYECRAELVEPEIRRYKALGRDCAMVMETVCRQTQVGDSEFQVEADMARHLLARGIQPTVLLVAFDQRLLRYRHPTPTANRLKRCGMLVICGSRGGLIACLTRIIHFGPIPEDLLKRHEAVCRVDAAYWSATKIGVPYGKVLQAGIDQYKKEGFAKEWELHHQGGPTGYAGRDFVVTPDEKHVVLDKQAVAWNPSITGTKAEDTFVVDGANRIVVTACSPDWPTIKVQAGGESFARPAILVR
ncbi:MAG: aminopeptidase P family N-terminal domain-containing protein [Planctomycetes bacterium]|nr:aminopeptidase P family N-terminal domain-containing protein [Planctomycetota bacterium]